MSMQIQQIKKQIDGMQRSLTQRNIVFENFIIDVTLPETELMERLKLENERLKQIINQNKPAPQPKIKKQPEKQPDKKPEKQDTDETFEEPVKEFNTITNMENIKRAFFSNDHNTFTVLINEHKLHYYVADYKYSSNNDGKPDYIARNLLRGFVQQFDDYRKYFMICFRCYSSADEADSKYNYTSLWVVNTTDNVREIIGDIYDDFNFTEVTDTAQFLIDIQKQPKTDTLLDESYVH